MAEAEQRIIYFEPNDIPNVYDLAHRLNKGVTQDNLVILPEEFTMSMDMQVIVPDRMDCGKRDYDTELRNNLSSIFQGTEIKLSNGEKHNMLTTDYTNMSYCELSVSGFTGQEMLLIKNVSIRYDANFRPKVTITFVDVRGNALLAPSEQEFYDKKTNSTKGVKHTSIFKSFFRHPSPRFLLTVKGFYGGSVTFTLCVTSFKTAFDPTKGDFTVTAEFTGFDSAFLSDLPFNLVLLSPYFGSTSGDKNDLWRREDFLCTDSATPLPTFNEFMRKMSDLIKRYKDIQDGESGIDVIDNPEKAKEQISDAKILEGNFRTMINKFMTNYKPKYNSANDEYRWYIENISGDEVKFINNIKNNANSFGKAEIDLFRNHFIEYNNKYHNGKWILPTGIKENSVNPTYINSRKSKNYKGYFCLPCNNFLKKISSDINLCSKKTNRDINAINQAYLRAGTDVLGFNTTIRNMFRIIFAHMDCFITSFYNLLYEISENSERTLGKYGLTGSNYWKDSLTDIPNKGEFGNNDKIPPFTAFYKRENGVRVEFFPEEEPLLRNLEEVKYVNKICDSLFKTKELFTDAEYSNFSAMAGLRGIKENSNIETPDNTNETVKKFKLSLYRTLKNLYDRWFAGMTGDRFKLKHPIDELEEMRYKLTNPYPDTYQDISFYSNFLFVDTFFDDISDVFFSDPKIMYNIVMDQSNGLLNGSVYDIMSKFLQMNHIALIDIPLFTNYYDMESIEKVFTPSNKLITRLGGGVTYFCMYSHEPSHLPSTGDKEYDEDSFDIAIDGKITSVARDCVFTNVEIDDGKLVFNVPAFGVTYGKQNQSIFTNISCSMENAKQTANSVQKMLQLSSIETNGITNRPNTASMDSFSIFSNMQYECKVEMLGCMNIMPGMCFQLNNIPLFRGAYSIISVEHTIEAGKMITKFNGLRICKNRIPYVDKIYTFAPYIQRLTEQYSSKIVKK